MQTYQIKRGQGKALERDGLRNLVEEAFEQARMEGGRVHASFGALASLTTWADTRTLYVDTEMRRDVADEVAKQTIRAYNLFLERATGYTAKERGKRAQGRAKVETP